MKKKLALPKGLTLPKGPVLSNQPQPNRPSSPSPRENQKVLKEASIRRTLSLQNLIYSVTLFAITVAIVISSLMIRDSYLQTSVNAEIHFALSNASTFSPSGMAEIFKVFGNPRLPENLKPFAADALKAADDYNATQSDASIKAMSDILVSSRSLASINYQDSMGATQSLIDNVKYFVPALALVFAFIGFVFSLYSRRRLLASIVNAKSIIKEFATGDLAFPIPTDSKTEFNDVYIALKEAQHTIGDIIRHTNQAIDSSRAQLQKSIEAAERTNTGITQELLALAERSDSVTETMNGVGRSSEEIATGATHTAESASNIAYKSSQVLQQSNNVLNTLTHDIESLKIVEHSTAQTSAEIKTLEKSVDEIEALMAAIKNISAQTKLLALNASIEAARAGEHGRGFSVVAEEVKKLAEETTLTTVKITDIFAELRVDTARTRQSISETVKRVNDNIVASERSKTDLSQTIHALGDLNDDITTVAAIAEEQSASAEDIINNVRDAIEILKHVTEAIEAIKTDVFALVENTSTQSEDIAGSFQQINQTLHYFKL